MNIWVPLNDFAIKYSMLLNTAYVKALIDNNILYVIPKKIHTRIMDEFILNYVHKGHISLEDLQYNFGKIRSVDAINHKVELDVNPEYEDIVLNMKNPKISFLAYIGLNKTSPVFYIEDETDDSEVSA